MFNLRIGKEYIGIEMCQYAMRVSVVTWEEHYTFTVKLFVIHHEFAIMRREFLRVDTQRDVAEHWLSADIGRQVETDKHLSRLPTTYMRD